MLKARLITGALLIAALVGLGLLDRALEERGWPAGALIAVVALLVIVPLLSWELTSLMRRCGAIAPPALLMGAGWSGLIATAGVPGVLEPAPDTTSIALALLTAVAIGAVMTRRDPRGAAGTIGAALLALVFCGILPGYWLKVRIDFSMQLCVGAVLVVKSSDIGAYFGGRAMGRRKLIAWLSPGKTWEGAMTGVLAAAGAAAALASWGKGALGVPSVPQAAAAGALLGVAGIFGDLAESLLKREAGVKDSGAILPGMGGLFDVLDSLLFAAPIAWLLLRAS